MRGCTSSFGCLIYIFITFWVLLFSIIFISSAQWLFDRDFYAETLTNETLIDAIYDDALPRIYNDNVFFRSVGEGDASNTVFGHALREIVPQDYVVSEINTIIDTFISYAQGDTTRFNYQIDTGIIRANLNDPARANQFAQALAQRLPSCEAGQTYFGKSDLPACLPSGVNAEQMTGQIANNLGNLTNSIPEQIDLFESTSRPETFPTFKFSDVSQATTQAVMIFAGVLLFINASMGSTRLRATLRRFSIMLLIPAGILLWGGEEFATLQDSRQPIPIQITINDKVIKEGPLFDATQDVIKNTAGRIGNDVVNISWIAVAIAGVVFLLSFLPTPGGGRGLDSTLNLPPSGKVGRMQSNHDSPIQGI